MKAVPHSTLPLATTSPFTPSGRSGRKDPQGWTQAFLGAAKSDAGRADTTPPAVGESPRVASGGSPSHSAATPLLPLDRSASSLPAARVTGLTVSATRIALAATRSDADSQHDGPAALAAPVQGSSQSRREKEAPAQTPRPASPRPQRSGEADPPAPIRVHVEHQAGGVAVWLGIDRRVACDCLHALIAGLRSPMRGAPTVVSLTCNGAAVFSRSPNHKDIP